MLINTLVAMLQEQAAKHGNIDCLLVILDPRQADDSPVRDKTTNIDEHSMFSTRAPRFRVDDDQLHVTFLGQRFDQPSLPDDPRW